MIDVEYFTLAAIFGLAFAIETMVTGKLFIHRDNLPVTGFMRWWAIISLGGISVANMLGFIRLYGNHNGPGIDGGNYVQGFFALMTLSLFLWVFQFHLDKWRKE